MYLAAKRYISIHNKIPSIAAMADDKKNSLKPVCNIGGVDFLPINHNVILTLLFENMDPLWLLISPFPLVGMDQVSGIRMLL